MDSGKDAHSLGQGPVSLFAHNVPLCNQSLYKCQEAMPSAKHILWFCF